MTKFEKEAERCADEYRYSDEYSSSEPYDIGYVTGLSTGFEKGAEYVYNKAKGDCKTAYIKGMRHLANALKEYDRTEGAWTDYFENTVNKILKRELEKVK